MQNQTATVTAAQPRPDEILFQSMFAYMNSAVLSIMANLRIADLLKDGPRASEQLANATNANEDRLYRVLRAATVFGLLTELDQRKFALTPVSELLISDRPNSMFPMALWITEPTHFRAFGELLHTTMTGEAGMKRLTGMEAWEYFDRNQEVAAIFNSAMTCLTEVVTPELLAAYDFSSAGTVVDVAGGHGRLLAAVLEKHPQLNGVLFDLPAVCTGAEQPLAKFGERAKIVSGDFFKSVPEGDTIMMKQIIHDWHDEPARNILRNCRRALENSKIGTLLLFEQVVSDNPKESFAKVLDLEMMIFPDGRERRAEEFRTLLASAGFEMTRIIPTKSFSKVIEARKK